MRWALLVLVGSCAVKARDVRALPLGTLAGLVEAGRDAALRAEAVARRHSDRSHTRSPMRVRSRPHFTRDYRPRYAPPAARW
ncbi:hypothetical protein ACE7GA_02450 [Roseomonas sp. CCTCC AB2023176]|uniref:hypothetical protein n=1 Tax=Roseomonas sp. CCTCC AB2023176 TaxID=3342640 RepID=UPI0035DB9083